MNIIKTIDCMKCCTTPPIMSLDVASEVCLSGRPPLAWKKNTLLPSALIALCVCVCVCVWEREKMHVHITNRPRIKKYQRQQNTQVTKIMLLHCVNSSSQHRSSRCDGDDRSAVYCFEVLGTRNLCFWWQVPPCPVAAPFLFFSVTNMPVCRGQLKCDGKRAETRFSLSAKWTSPFKWTGPSVQSTTGCRGVRIGGSNAGYTTFRGSVKGTGYPLHSPVSPSLPQPVRHRVQSHFNCSLQ